MLRGRGPGREIAEAEPGYGFVDEQTPELTVAVVPSRRGRGYGDELLTALLAQAAQDGFAALSRARIVPLAA